MTDPLHYRLAVPGTFIAGGLAGSFVAASAWRHCWQTCTDAQLLIAFVAVGTWSILAGVAAVALLVLLVHAFAGVVV